MFYHQDTIGSISVVSDVYGSPLNWYTYDVYGSPNSVTESVYNSFLFTEEPYDLNGLIYLRARYYDSTTGRFLTPDTFFGKLYDPLSQNRYIYCSNNPVVYTDPSGHLWGPVIQRAAPYVVRAAQWTANKAVRAAQWVNNKIGTKKICESEAGNALTNFDDVAEYIAKNGRLPDNFITKAEARGLGWDPSKGNLANVAPGKSIGDIFKNKGNPLPNAPGRVWYEADINYSGGFRGSERIIYSNDGMIYKTTDHFTTFTQIK